MKPPPLPSERAAIAVEIVVEAPAWERLGEAEDVVRRAIAAAAAAVGDGDLQGAGVCVLLSDDEAIAKLNLRWRGLDKATNVLSFPAPAGGPPPGEAQAPLGDIAIAYGTLMREAGEGGKSAAAHLAHLVVHGFLHLVGYDHLEEDDAECMESLERDILARIGVADPYASCDAGI